MTDKLYPSMDPAMKANAAQLAARNIKAKPKGAGGSRQRTGLLSNPTTPQPSAENSNNLFGGSLQAPGDFNFSAPVQGLVLPPPTFGHISNTKSNTQSSNEHRFAGDDRATKRQFGGSSIDAGLTAKVGAEEAAKSVFGAQPPNPFASTTTSNIFNSPAPANSTSNIFGAASTTPFTFGSIPATKPPSTSSVFNSPAPTTGSLFGNKQPAPQTSNIFGSSTTSAFKNPFAQPQASTPAPPTNIFGAPTAAAQSGPESTEVAPSKFGSLASQVNQIAPPTSSVFGTSANAPQTSNMFGKPGTGDAPKNNMFGTSNTANANPTFGPPPAFSPPTNGEQYGSAGNSLGSAPHEAAPIPLPFDPEELRKQMFNDANKYKEFMEAYRGDELVVNDPTRFAAAARSVWEVSMGIKSPSDPVPQSRENLPQNDELPRSDGMFGRVTREPSQSGPAKTQQQQQNVQPPPPNGIFGQASTVSQPAQSNQTKNGNTGNELFGTLNKPLGTDFNNRPENGTNGDSPLLFGSQSAKPQTTGNIFSAPEDIEGTARFPGDRLPDWGLPADIVELYPKLTPAEKKAEHKAIVENYKTNFERAAVIPEEKMKPLAPPHFDEYQLKIFYRGFRLHKLNRLLANFFVALGQNHDPYPAFEWYRVQRTYIESLAGIKRIYQHDLADTPNKRLKPSPRPAPSSSNGTFDADIGSGENQENEDPVSKRPEQLQTSTSAPTSNGFGSSHAQTSTLNGNAPASQSSPFNPASSSSSLFKSQLAPSNSSNASNSSIFNPSQSSPSTASNTSTSNILKPSQPSPFIPPAASSSNNLAHSKPSPSKPPTSATSSMFKNMVDSPSNVSEESSSQKKIAPLPSKSAKADGFVSGNPWGSLPGVSSPAKSTTATLNRPFAGLPGVPSPAKSTDVAPIKPFAGLPGISSPAKSTDAAPNRPFAGLPGVSSPAKSTTAAPLNLFSPVPDISISSPAKSAPTSNHFGSTFGTSTPAKSAPATNLFGSLSGTSTPAGPAPTSNLFGSLSVTSTPAKLAPASNLFGSTLGTSTSAKPAPTSNLFGSLSGTSTPAKSAPATNPFGSVSGTSSPARSVLDSHQPGKPMDFSKNNIFGHMSEPPSDHGDEEDNDGNTPKPSGNNTLNHDGNVAKSPGDNTWTPGSAIKFSNSGFSFGVSNNSSLHPSAVASATTSRDTSPGITTDGSADGEEEQKDVQLVLSAGGPGEEDEEAVHEVRARGLKFHKDEEAGDAWKVKGTGPLRVLKHKETGATRILLRADPSGTIIINKALLSEVVYEATGKTVKVLAAGDNGEGLESWLLQVKTEGAAKALADILEEHKA